MERSWCLMKYSIPSTFYHAYEYDSGVRLFHELGTEQLHIDILDGAVLKVKPGTKLLGVLRDSKKTEERYFTLYLAGRSDLADKQLLQISCRPYEFDVAKQFLKTCGITEIYEYANNTLELIKEPINEAVPCTMGTGAGS